MSEVQVYILIGMLIIILIPLFILSIWGVNAGIYEYQVWSQGKSGQAELAKADWNRQIVIIDARSKEESAHLLAKAEIIRAQGIAKVNQIIGQSLNKNESYLKYLWIENLKEKDNQVIYVPTEANLPILEATRNKH